MHAQGQRRFCRNSKAGGISGVANAALAWCQSLLSPAGLAHSLSLVCFLAQVILINVFLVQYLSSTVLLTMTIDVPLLLHLAWFWRVDSSYRAAPTQWFCYSWVHAAKVVVLFCRVMPRLTSSTPAVTEDVLRGSDFSINASYFQDLFSPTMLANLLLITPVFYALLMFRTSKAIFGSLSKRVTVDLIMHYDMLWHVVIDMVDQVDMFYYARLAEWVGSEALEQHKNSLVLIQTAVPFLLFFSMVLQAQAFPGVVTDKWSIPVETPASASGRDSLRRASDSLPRLSVLSQGSAEQLEPTLRSSQASQEAVSRRPSQEISFSDRVSTGGVVHRKTTSGPGTERAWFERQERARRRRLQGVMNLIQRHNIIIARKRSAIASIFLIDIPFLTIRVWLWALLQHTYFPGLGIKNGLCIVLNVMQYTLVALASKESFKRIKREIAEYITRFHSGTLKEEAEGESYGERSGQEEGEGGPPMDQSVSELMHQDSVPSLSASKEQAHQMKQALHKVGRDTARGVGICVYIFALTLAFAAGFIIAQGETVVELFIAWVQETIENQDQR